MEDFLVLSILDLRLDNQQQRVNKREIIAYIMLGDTCIDSLVLGSPNASLQDQTKLGRRANGQNESGGAADQNLREGEDVDEERGSYHDEGMDRYGAMNGELRDLQKFVEPGNSGAEPHAATQHLSKKTKIPLSGLKMARGGAPAAF